jgi:Flp pilus assembly protein TadG
MKKAQRKLKSSNGQSLLEFALVLPLVFLLIVNAVNFGAFLYAWITVANAVRTGADYMVLGGASLGMPHAPDPTTDVIPFVKADCKSLMNKSSGALKVRVCTNNSTVDSTTIQCFGDAGNNPPADPEPASYVLGSVDVTYTYQPIIALWDFPGLGIHATLPATTIHRQALTRMIQ